MILMTLKQVLFGTHNPNKIKRFQTHCRFQTAELISPQDINLPKVFVAEDGDSEHANAKQKAKAYFEASNYPSVALDTGFYITGLSDKQQPGKHVQRVAGVTDETSDDDRYDLMIKYYSDLAKETGGQREAYFLDIFCYYDGISIDFKEAKRPVILTDTPITKDVHFPISCLYKLPQTGKYYHHASPEEMAEFVKPSAQALTELVDGIQISYTKTKTT
jgi:inosine/xanthosine triphosphate pyrophosphatase family protein